MKVNMTMVINFFVIVFLACIVAFLFTIYVDMTKPAPDPFAKCVQLPSSDKANYWRCEK
ncbi:hypothetical protein phiPLPE_52 [Iodobacter phage PhiPLPE]|uniref:Uncharacterized protein n=1 Tax=Iodobacter phage PhiPLPE TaxID=551895 RepID=B5AX71_9CAUD|nr:hypothetical protein phiPLPE_52 [Iodobacter phage PhiPLPE]ACG60374.1 hypothetical protein phiPLPE_52 [Iodobacter phage PhiPLPE]